MSAELTKAHKYEEEEKQKIPAEEKPVFHVTPPIGWMNDPNGFSFYNGEIHLFYQYHPYTTGVPCTGDTAYRRIWFSGRRFRQQWRRTRNSTILAAFQEAQWKQTGNIF